MTDSTQPWWLSIQQAAEYLGVSTKTIRRRIADGSVTGYRLGPRVIRLRALDVEGLLEKIPAGEFDPNGDYE